MDIGPCLLIWLVGFITGIAVGILLNRADRKQCLQTLDQARSLRDETASNLDKIAALGLDITAKYAEMLKMDQSIRKFQDAISQTQPPNWDQEKKKLPDQL